MCVCERGGQARVPPWVIEGLVGGFEMYSCLRRLVV